MFTWYGNMRLCVLCGNRPKSVAAHDQMGTGRPDLVSGTGTGSQQEEKDHGDRSEENYSSHQSAVADRHISSSCWMFPGGGFAIFVSPYEAGVTENLIEQVFVSGSHLIEQMFGVKEISSPPSPSPSGWPGRRTYV